MAGYSLVNILKGSLSRGSTIHGAARYLSSSPKPHGSYLPSLPPTAMPWLMLPPDVKDGPNGPTDNYFNILDKSMVKLDRQQAHGLVPPNTKCIGTTRGWVAFTCESDESVFLVDPYTKECSIKLPPLEYVQSTGFQSTLAGNPSSKSFAILNIPEYTNTGKGFMYSNNHSESGWQEHIGVSKDRPLLAYNRKDCTVYSLHWQESGLLKIYCWDVLSENAPKVVNEFCFTDQIVDGQRLLSSFMNVNYKTRTWGQHMQTYLVVEEADGRQQEPDLLLVIRHFYVDKDDSGPYDHAYFNCIELLRNSPIFQMLFNKIDQFNL